MWLSKSDKVPPPQANILTRWCPFTLFKICEILLGYNLSRAVDRLSMFSAIILCYSSWILSLWWHQITSDSNNPNLLNELRQCIPDVPTRISPETIHNVREKIQDLDLYLLTGTRWSFFISPAMIIILTCCLSVFYFISNSIIV